MGRPAGIPNKTTTALREAILEAGENVGRVDSETMVSESGRTYTRHVATGEGGLTGYLEGLATHEPSSFASLLGRVLPTTLTGLNGKDLFPERSDPKQIASAILSIIQGSRPVVKEPVLIENSHPKHGKVDGLTIEHEPETAETLGKTAENDE